MDSTSTLMAGALFGAIGLGFFVYGKKQNTFIPLFCGIGLMAFPYFITNGYIFAITGIILTVLPFIIK